jgi:hypothetical protein
VGAVGEAAAAHGLAVPTGVFAGVGVGSMLMGGIGRLARMHGLSVQHLLEVDIVTADGEVRRLRGGGGGGGGGGGLVSGAGDGGAGGGAGDEELWWAVRGAAPAFGVVTRLVVRAFPVPSALHGRRLTQLPADAAAAAQRLAGIEGAMRALPEGRQVDLCLVRGPLPAPGDSSSGGRGATLGVFPCSVDGAFTAGECRALGFAAGDLAQGRYCDIPYHSMLPDEEETPAKASEEVEGGDGKGMPSQATPGMFSYVRQWFVEELGEGGMAVLAAAAAAAPTDDSLFMLQHAGTASHSFPFQLYLSHALYPQP